MTNNGNITLLSQQLIILLEQLLQKFQDEITKNQGKVSYTKLKDWLLLCQKFSNILVKLANTNFNKTSTNIEAPSINELSQEDQAIIGKFLDEQQSGRND